MLLAVVGAAGRTFEQQRVGDAALQALVPAPLALNEGFAAPG